MRRIARSGKLFRSEFVNMRYLERSRIIDQGLILYFCNSAPNEEIETDIILAQR